MVVATPGKSYLSSIGLQLWTVRDQIEHDLPGTLRAIKAAGYAQIELMRTLQARDVVQPARELGLGVTSAFIEWSLLAQPVPDRSDELARTVAFGREIGLKYLVFGYIGKGARETIAQMKTHAARANAFGRQCRDAGIQLCYHHHSFEFAPLDDGHTTGWEIFVNEFDPLLVQFEIDVFWAAIAGLDPIRLLRDLRGRVAQVHLKDLKPGSAMNRDEGAVPPDAFKELGRGCLDLRQILVTCAETGVAQCHVEQDQSPDPLASIAVSLNFLRQLSLNPQP
ncbi:MAG TPA: sugar phosphate isomerase/epimerase [Lacunisphaera sp.]